MKSISPAKHGKLVNALQAKLLALQGRGGDTEVAHLTPGEIVLPRSLQTPSLMKQIAELAARQGIDPRRLTVGHQANSVNPKTGTPEFLEEVVVRGTRGGGSRSGLGWGATYGLFSNRLGYDTSAQNPGDQSSSAAPEDDPNIPTIDVPQGGFQKLLQAPGYSWNGVYFTAPDGAKFKAIENITVMTAVSRSGGIDPTTLSQITRDMRSYTQEEIDSIGKQISHRLDSIASNLKGASNEDLQWGWAHANVTKKGFDIPFFDLLGIAYKTRLGKGATADSAFKAGVDYYSEIESRIMEEIRLRVSDGRWGDLRVPADGEN